MNTAQMNAIIAEIRALLSAFSAAYRCGRQSMMKAYHSVIFNLLQDLKEYAYPDCSDDE